MTPDELRALADALDSDPARGMTRAADYLRACADAQPVAWLRPENRVEEECTARTRISIGERCPPIGTWRPLYTHPAPVAPHHAMLDSHRRLVEQAIQSAEHPSGMSTHDGKARIDASILRRMLAIIDSLPAVPQAEPKRGINWQPIETAPRDNKRPLLLASFDDRGVLSNVDFNGSWECESESWEMPQEYYFWNSENGMADEPTHWAYQPEGFAQLTKETAAPQAEPKREPLSDEQMRAVLIAEARRIAAQAGEKDPDSLPVNEEMLAQVMLAGRAVERAHGIGGSDAE